jgi:hypothetical protein
VILPLTLAALAAVSTPPADADRPEDALVTLRGRVVDARTGEPLAGASASVERARRQAVADAGGRFAIDGLPRRLTLRVGAPGYRDLELRLALGTEPPELHLPLEPAPPRLGESVTVTATAPPSLVDPPAALARRYEADVLRQLGSVVASDPLRAVQALPGVAANDELNAGFAARGHGFEAVGLYLDGVRLQAPLHTVRDVNDGYSLTIFNQDVLDGVTLLPGTAPARFGNHVGATLSVRTRDGRSDALHGRASVGAAGAFATLEGPLGGGGKASWLASGRRSFLGYIIDRVEDRPTLALGWRDLTAKVTARPRPSQSVGLMGLLGRARYENTEPRPGPHEIESADAGTSLLHLSFRSGSGAGALGLVGFALRETGDNHDTDGFERFRSEAVSAGFQAEASRISGPCRFDAGLEARRVREDVLSRRVASGTGAVEVREDYDRTGSFLGAFAQASWVKAGGGLVATAGARVDRLSATGESLVLPRASLEWELDGDTRLVAALGSFGQFPAFASLYGEFGNPSLDAARSRQVALALERRLGRPLRVRVEAYAQRDRRLPFGLSTEYRLVDGRVVPPAPDARLESVLEGPARGLEVSLVATSLGPVGGYVAYALAHARREDPSGLSFDADFDQRHTVSAQARVRLGASGALTTSFRHGSGFPFAGFVERREAGFFVAAERNRLYPPAYTRWDVRGEKRFTRGRFALELFVEVANVLDRENQRYNEVTRVDGVTGRARLDRDTLLPLLPLFGATVEF